MLTMQFDNIGWYIETYGLPVLPDPPRLWIFTGTTASQHAAYWMRDGLFTITLEPWFSPFDYHWPVSGSDVAIFDFDPYNQRFAEDLMLCLMSANADIVQYFNTFDLTHHIIKRT